ANIIAMYRLIGRMRPRDKVLAIAFAVCAAFAFGDHLAFAANFQPTIILPLLLGKLLGGSSGFLLAVWLSVPKAEQLAAAEAPVPNITEPGPAESRGPFLALPIPGVS